MTRRGLEDGFGCVEVECARDPHRVSKQGLYVDVFG